ncbi:hypothetical protein BCR37DRAFT_380719 [Protomyces lactucae-debilis]|uniref:DNA repair protein rhp7 treble clef domain-containing protein n=1 Tax=Protomyces lactucae-debilis TaxID=2754530 RepID=A0A1Y2FAC6_PROLT|nr:uncharacterized protein BCR37DRAFT_380719 [Protomyces lactucae-debilis]ORY80870.1 hypothetical protein BCR37DRAFT_380719 [Protomyces lactucae-debilis]
MSRNNARSNVRGPNSALTEFLRSRGIRIENQGRNRPRPAVPVPAIGEETTGTLEEQAELESTAEASTPPTAVATRKSSKKRKKNQVSDDESDGDYEPLPRPSAGQIEFCAECNTRFTVTPYNKEATSGSGLLCMPCGKALTTPTKPRAAPIARKKRAKATLDGERFLVPKLQDLSIRTIAKHIDQVEALGDIGHFNLDKICQIICKNRQLSAQTLPLFLDASLTTLSLYDCANLHKDTMAQIGQFCPRLKALRLHLCGQITDAVLMSLIARLGNLTALSLFGAFLITTGCWQKVFQETPNLVEFEVSDTSRFDHETMQQLVKHCPDLRVLTLKRLTHLGSEAITLLAGLSKLTHLNLSHAGLEVTDEAIDLILSADPNLELLDLSGLTSLTDATLASIGKHCKYLKILRLNECDLFTNDGCVALFSNWQGHTGLRELALERCVALGDEAVAAILRHSGGTLQKLVLNSWDTVTEKGCLMLAGSQALPVCEVLDVSWIRAVDDLVVRRIVEHASALRKLLVWGNNLLTAVEHPGKAVIVGRESG